MDTCTLHFIFKEKFGMYFSTIVVKYTCLDFVYSMENVHKKTSFTVKDKKYYFENWNLFSWGVNHDVSSFTIKLVEWSTVVLLCITIKNI